MIIKLKNNGGYGGLEEVAFPLEIRARRHSLFFGASVLGLDLNAVIGNRKHFEPTESYLFSPSEFEVIEE